MNSSRELQLIRDSAHLLHCDLFELIGETHQ